jgi:uncharacterized membrane protein
MTELAGGPKMAQAAHLWAIAYADPRRAEQVRQEIIKLGEQHCLILLDTAVVMRNPDGSVMLDGEPFRGDTNTKRGSIASFFARLALVSLPLTEAAVGAWLRCAGGAASEVGIDEDFISDIEPLIRPGTSALFVFDQVCGTNAVLQGIRGLGGTVLKTNVDLERAKLIQSTLATAVPERFKSGG